MYIILLIFGFLLKECLPLQSAQVIIPSYRVRGQYTQMECKYDLEDDERLYSVKWYRNNEEFYRFVPKLDPPKNSYNLPGIKVDLSRSDEHRVSLQQVTLKSSGLYRCEVSAEAPNFVSAADEKRMEVIYLPKEGPRITGNEQEYRKGDYLFLNCTSGRSYPAAVLSWYIDGQKVIDESMLVEYPATVHAHGLLTVALGLRVPLGRSMQVRCAARVAPMWRDGSDAFVADTQLADSKEAMLLVRSSTHRSKPHLVTLFASIILVFLVKPRFKNR